MLLLAGFKIDLKAEDYLVFRETMWFMSAAFNWVSCRRLHVECLSSAAWLVHHTAAQMPQITFAMICCLSTSFRQARLQDKWALGFLATLAQAGLQQTSQGYALLGFTLLPFMTAHDNSRDNGVAWLQSIRHIAVLLSSSSEGGLQAVQSAHIRLQDVTSSAPAQPQSLGWLCLPGSPTSKAANLLLCKLHKVRCRMSQMQMGEQPSRLPCRLKSTHRS